MNEQKEPFGYFRVEPFGWVDCGENDEGAVALYDQETVNALQGRCDELLKQRDELLAELKRMVDVFGRDGWISVLDRLPERFLQVLVTVEEDGERFVEIDAYQVNDWCSPSDGRKVTHWRSLLEPAAEQKGGAE